LLLAACVKYKVIKAIWSYQAFKAEAKDKHHCIVYGTGYHRGGHEVRGGITTKL